MGSHRPDIGERNGNGNSRSVTLPKPRRHRLKQELTRPVPAGAHYGRTRPGANRHGLSRAQEARQRSASTDLLILPRCRRAAWARCIVPAGNAPRYNSEAGVGPRSFPFEIKNHGVTGFEAMLL